MEEKITLKKVITIVKLSSLFIWFWPLSQNTSKRKVLCMELYQLVCLILTVAVLTSMVYCVVKNQNDQELVLKSTLGWFPCSHVIWNIVCRAFVYRRLQHVIFEMENFCALIEPHEETIIQREYINKYGNFYAICIITFYTTIFGLLLGPLVVEQPLPVLADFPFDASGQPLRAITYVHQILVGLMIASNMSVNALMALLLWFTSAKFKLLIEDIQMITNIYDLTKCIVKHQCLLKYAEEIALTIRPFALATVIFSTATALVVFGLVFILDAALPLKFQCVFIIFSALSIVFMYAWPAEHLLFISGHTGQAAFEIDWYNKSEKLRRNLQIIIMRSQKPVVIGLPCGLPSLSLGYYASYLSSIFSYFTTMRLMFEKRTEEA